MELTAEQRDVAEQSGKTQQLVTAGSGTGKTLTLIHRLNWLLTAEETSSHEILVLSFSRAAVSEMRARIAATKAEAQHVDVRTFDSYATQLLSEADPDGSWQRSTYDQRIRAATRLLTQDNSAVDLIADLRHVVIDEVQDLVGVRIDLVKALLEAAPVGFTLFGDPAQGIYGFQLDDPKERIRGAQSFYDWIRDRYANSVKERSLQTNFRAREVAARVALKFRGMLCAEDPDFKIIQHDLRTALLASTPLGDFSNLVDAHDGFALLCRTNGEALIISRELHRRGISHFLQRSVEDVVLPPWIGALFRLPVTRVSREDIQDSLKGQALPEDAAWMLLKRMAGSSRSKSVDLADVRRQMAAGRIPDEVTSRQANGVVVSTVHRAKGLEFDQVIVVDPGEARDDVVDQAEVARTLFVAMTRPRDHLYRVPRIDEVTDTRADLRGGRWVELGTGRARKRPIGMEVRREDIETELPAGTVGYIGNPDQIQSYMATEVSPGNPVSLVRETLASPQEIPTYCVLHDGTRIGATSEAFAAALTRTLGARNRTTWPATVEQLHVECVETVIGSQAAGMNHGLGWSGVWLRPRITGLGSFTWESKEKQ